MNHTNYLNSIKASCNIYLNNLVGYNFQDRECPCYLL